VYKTIPGWKCSTRGLSQYEQLPQKARDYLQFLEQQSGVEIGGISTGPERNETIIRAGSKLERLIQRGTSAAPSAVTG
jgi:adenylosuccinate synthase